MERSEKVFKEFIDLCREVTNNDTVVLELLQKRYNRTNLHFLWSNEFPDLIDRCSQKIQADRDNKYVYIKEFTTELKAYKAKPLKHLRDTRAMAKGDGGSQVRKAEACPELEPPAKKPRLTNSSCNMSHKPKERFETTSQFAQKVARQVQTPSCTLIPLSLMCNSPSGSNRDSVSTGETSMEDERREVASVGHRVFVTPVKVNEVPDLHLPQLQIVLEKSDVKMTQSQSSRQNLVESSSDDETDDNASTSKDCQSQLPPKEDDARDSRLQKHIQKLELLLKKISEEIKRLQETELSLEDMDREDSSYTLEDRYKKRFVKVWNRLCKLKGRDTTTGREIERKLNYCGTNYPEVNKSISRFVNKFRVFPDYSDIHEIIARSNRKHNLGIRKSAVDRLAREAFTDVGNILQKRRMTDHVDNFGCHLTENVKSRDDPALFDSRLRQRLDDNSKVSKTNLDEIISKYAQKQDEDPGQEEEEEEDEEEEEEEEEVDGEDEKKFMEDMEQIEEIVLTDESSVDPEEEEEDEEELDKENERKDNESKENNAGGGSKDNIDGANIDLCTDKSASESLSLLDDTSDELDDLPLFCEMPIERHSDHQQRNFSDSLPTTESEPTVLSSENDTEKAEDVENANEERVLPVEEESLDISIVDPPPLLSSSSAADVQTLPPSSRPTDSPSCISSSSEVIGFGSAAIVNGSLASGSTSDEAEPVNALVPVSTPIDIICLDDETNSPVKNKFHSLNGSTDTQDIGNGTLKQTNSKEKMSSMALGLVRLKPPCENVLRRFTKVDATSHRKALSLRQPTTDVSPPPTEAVTGSSDEEDVVEIMSIPAPNGRTDFGSAAIRQEVRSSTNTTQSTSRVGRRNSSTDECCIMTTVEEHVVSTVVTSRDERRSDGVRGQQVEMRQHTKKTMRVVGQIVHFNADPYGRSRQKQQQPRMNPAMQGSGRISQMNQRQQQQQAMHSVNRSTAEMNHRPSGPSRQPTLATRVTGQTNRGSLAAVPATSLNKQLDDISSQIVSSIFKNQPKKSSSTDADIIICDDSSPSVDVVSTNKASKVNKQTVNRTNWGASNPRKNIMRQVEPRGTVARTSQGSNALLAARSSSHNQNGMHLSPKPSHPSRTLPQLPDVIDLI